MNFHTCHFDLLREFRLARMFWLLNATMMCTFSLFFSQSCFDRLLTIKLLWLCVIILWCYFWDSLRDVIVKVCILKPKHCSCSIFNNVQKVLLLAFLFDIVVLELALFDQLIGQLIMTLVKGCALILCMWTGIQPIMWKNQATVQTAAQHWFMSLQHTRLLYNSVLLSH